MDSSLTASSQVGGMETAPLFSRPHVNHLYTIYCMFTVTFQNDNALLWNQSLFLPEHISFPWCDNASSCNMYTFSNISVCFSLANVFFTLFLVTGISSFSFNCQMQQLRSEVLQKAMTEKQKSTVSNWGNPTGRELGWWAPRHHSFRHFHVGGNANICRLRYPTTTNLPSYQVSGANCWLQL